MSWRVEAISSFTSSMGMFRELMVRICGYRQLLENYYRIHLKLRTKKDSISIKALNKPNVMPQKGPDQYLHSKKIGLRCMLRFRYRIFSVFSANLLIHALWPNEAHCHTEIDHLLKPLVNVVCKDYGEACLVILSIISSFVVVEYLLWRKTRMRKQAST